MLLAPVVRRADNSIQRINRYPADSVVCFVNTYPWIALSTFRTTGAWWLTRLTQLRRSRLVSEPHSCVTEVLGVAWGLRPSWDRHA